MNPGFLLAALAALALPTHVEPQISEAPAGSRTTFGFLVEHGCDGSPTVQVSIRLPDGAFDAVPVAPAGWTGVVEPASPPVVTFTGGPLAADAPETFSVELVTPNQPGATVLFPTVQTCEAGEIGWIDTEEGSDEPAPRIVLTENADPILPPDPVGATTTATATTLVEAHDDGAEEATATGQTTEDGNGAPLLPLLLGVGAFAVGLAVYVLRGRSRR